MERRSVLGWVGAAVVGTGCQPAFAKPGTETRPDSLDVDNFLRSGVVANPMGVSGQAGKSRPETGVILRYDQYVSSSRLCLEFDLL